MTRIAVISDVHAFLPEPGAETFAEKDPSWVSTVPDHRDTRRGPFQALEALIAADVSVQADVLVCCGDMGDKADHAGVAYTWSYLETIRRRIGASALIGVTGNHDVDSRNKSKRDDPMYMTRNLQPPFPIDQAEVAREYWSRNVAKYTIGDTDFVLLNTAAEHETEELAKRGRVTDHTLERLREVVDTTTSSTRVLVCHHHPYRHDAIDRGDYSEMDGGPEVLRILQDNGDWLVLHGHRHYPNVAYATGGARAPVIFAAGSFSARLYPELLTRVRNQFHIIELAGAGSHPGTSGLTGTIRSWEWSSPKGWTRPTSSEGIPDASGFGYRSTIDAAADAIIEAVAQTEDRYIPLEDVLAAKTELRYLIPRDRLAALQIVRKTGTVAIFPEEFYSCAANEIFMTKVL